MNLELSVEHHLIIGMLLGLAAVTGGWRRFFQVLSIGAGYSLLILFYKWLLSVVT
jgi:hypothetical protein